MAIIQSVTTKPRTSESMKSIWYINQQVIFTQCTLLPLQTSGVTGVLRRDPSNSVPSRGLTHQQKPMLE